MITLVGTVVNNKLWCYSILVHLITGESRRRHQFVERPVDNLASTLASPHVIKRLGEYSTILATLNQQAFSPNVRHGVVTLPKKLR